QTSLNVDFGAFLDVLAHNFREPLPGDDVVPLGPILPFSGLVFESFVSGEAELGYGRTPGGEFDLRVFSQISNEHNFVKAFCHEFLPFLLRSIYQRLPFSERPITRALHRFYKTSGK